jgi:hypothetical protein
MILFPVPLLLSKKAERRREARSYLSDTNGGKIMHIVTLSFAALLKRSYHLAIQSSHLPGKVVVIDDTLWPAGSRSGLP